MVSILYLFLGVSLFVSESFGNPTPVFITSPVAPGSTGSQSTPQPVQVPCRNMKIKIRTGDFSDESEVSHGTNYKGASDHTRVSDGCIPAEIKDAATIRTRSRSLIPTTKAAVTTLPNLDRRGSKGLSDENIVAIVIGAVTIILAIISIVITYFGWRRRRSFFERLCGGG
ncbi:hypothetical protein F4781DRAFT_16389 [Annulohypoxylon bovei var. microspora]|nr:hypothetical protein F4781DRAFT_16389 [Annulohypoxylon bovei var. microspora]